jgi:hypothetical protein
MNPSAIRIALLAALVPAGLATWYLLRPSAPTSPQGTQPIDLATSKTSAGAGRSESPADHILPASMGTSGGSAEPAIAATTRAERSHRASAAPAQYAPAAPPPTPFRAHVPSPSPVEATPNPTPRSIVQLESPDNAGRPVQIRILPGARIPLALHNIDFEAPQPVRGALDRIAQDFTETVLSDPPTRPAPAATPNKKSPPMSRSYSPSSPIISGMSSSNSINLGNWNQASSTADQQFRSLYGNAAFNSAGMEAAMGGGD